MFRAAIALSLGIVLALTLSVFAFAGSTAGSAAYQQYCAGCHGANGQGTAYGPNIQGESGDVASAVRHGEDGMPSYSKSVIDGSTLKSLSAYVGSLRKSSGGHEYERSRHAGGENGGAAGNQYGHGRHDGSRHGDRDDD